jgi:hypothetical protein
MQRCYLATLQKFPDNEAAALLRSAETRPIDTEMLRKYLGLCDFYGIVGESRACSTQPSRLLFEGWRCAKGWGGTVALGTGILRQGQT